MQMGTLWICFALAEPNAKLFVKTKQKLMGLFVISLNENPTL